jgi:hypothetical protein
MVESLIFRLPGCVGLLGLLDGFPRQAHFSCKKTKPLSTGMSSLEDKMAATTARSIVIINTYTSGYVEENGAKPETGPFSRTAKIILSLLAL